MHGFARPRGAAHRSATDADALEALEALIKTYRTAESGLLYETRPVNTIAASVQRALSESLADYQKVRAERESLSFRNAEILGCSGVPAAYGPAKPEWPAARTDVSGPAKANDSGNCRRRTCLRHHRISKRGIVLKAKLLSWKELAPEVHHFDFEVPGVPELAFTPGQFVSVLEKVDGKEITRAYSIASPRGGNQFALCLNRVPDGLLSSFLFTLRPGEEVEMHEPLGYFTLRHPGRHAVFVATGTGIAPFRSMLLDHLPRTQPHITLLFGTRHEQGLLYREDMERMAREFKTFRFLPTLTRARRLLEGPHGPCASASG